MKLEDLHKPETIKPLLQKLKIDVTDVDHSRHLDMRKIIVNGLNARNHESPDAELQAVTESVAQATGLSELYAETIAYMLVAHAEGISFDVMPHNLVAHYHGVASQLRAMGATGDAPTDSAERAADYISERVDTDAVSRKLLGIGEDFVKALDKSDRIKAAGHMNFTVKKTEGDRVKVSVKIDGAEPVADVASMFLVVAEIYETIFGREGHMSNVSINNPARTMSFEASGPMKDLFECWQKDRAEEVGRG